MVVRPKKAISVRKFIFITLAIVVGAVLFAIFSEKRDQRLLKAFLSESPHLRSVTFDGQQRYLVINDAESLTCIADGVSHAGRGGKSGSSYSVIFQMEDGTRIKTFVTLDGRDMTIAGAHDDVTSDPEYYLATLPANIPTKLANGLLFLEAAEVPKEKRLTIQ